MKAAQAVQAVQVVQAVQAVQAVQSFIINNLHQLYHNQLPHSANISI